MNRLHGIAVDHPLRVLLVFGLFLALSAPGLLRLRILTDGRALVPERAPEASADRSIRDEFGVRDVLVAVVRTEDGEGVFNPRTLAHVAALTRELQALPGVGAESVTSLATEPGDHVHTGSFDFRAWLDPVPATGEEARDLARRIARAKIFSGTLLSTDSPPSATAILVGVEDGADRTAIAAVVERTARASVVPGDSVLLAGAPLAESGLGTHLLQDLALLVPIAFALLGAILFLCLRSFWGAALPLLGVGTCLLATFGWLGWFGVPVYLTILAAPVILIGVGVAESIHVLDQVFHVRRTHPAGDLRASVRRGTSDVGRAVVQTSVTTAIGFLSFAVSPLPPVRAFGFATAAGVLVCMVWTLAVLPACLTLLGRRVKTGSGRAALRDKLAPVLGSWTRFILARRRFVLAGAVAAAVLAAFGASRVRVQDSWIAGFSPHSELRRHTELVDELFGGTHLLRVRLSADAIRARGHVDLGDIDGTGMLLPAATVDAIARECGGAAPAGAFVGERLILKATNVPAGIPSWQIPELRIVDARAEAGGDARAEPGGDARAESGGMRLHVRNVNLPDVPFRDQLPPGLVEFDYEMDARGRLVEPAMLTELQAFEAHLSARRDLGVGAVLGPWAHVANLNVMLGADAAKAREVLGTRKGIARTLELYEKNRGERRMREVFRADHDRGLVTVLLKNASYETVGELMSSIRDYEREHLAPIGVRVDLGGDLALSQATIDGIVRTQILSLALALLGVLLATAVMARSIAAGIACALPCAAAALVTYAAMGVFGIPLGVATGMFAGITIGVGDDYAIHVWERMRRDLRRGEAVGPSIVAAMSDVGPAVLVDAVAVGAAFAVLLLSRVPTDARLGGLLVLSIAGCLAATLVLLPPVLQLLARPAAAASREPAAPAGSARWTVATLAGADAAASRPE